MEAMLFEGRLRTREPSVKEYLHIFVDSDNNFDATNSPVCFDLLISATNRSERISKKIDTSWVHLGLANPDAIASDEVYLLSLKQLRLSSRERGETISFVRKRDLFKFQNLITGNRVVQDLARVEITCQYSRNPDKKWKIWEGVPVTEEGRVQLWKIDDAAQDQLDPRASSYFGSYTSSRDSGSRRRDSSSTLTSPMTRPMSPSTVSIPSIDSEPPQIPPIVFSSAASMVSDVSNRESRPSNFFPPQASAPVSSPELPTGFRGSDPMHYHRDPVPDDVSSLSTTTSSFLEAQYGIVSPPSSRSSIPPSMRTVTAMSFSGNTTPRPLSTRPSSVTSGGGTSVITIDGKGNKGTIIQTPEAPSLVLFQRDMLLIIDVDNHIEIDPSLCDCQKEEKESAIPTCTMVILKTGKGGPKDISARRAPTSPGMTGWNLAAAGRSQRKIPGCLEDVKNLRLLTLDFKSVDDRLDFVKYFAKLKDIYWLNSQGTP